MADPETTVSKTCTRCGTPVEWSDSDHDWIDSDPDSGWDWICPGSLAQERHTLEAYAIPLEKDAEIRRMQASMVDENDLYPDDHL